MTLPPTLAGIRMPARQAYATSEYADKLEALLPRVAEAARMQALQSLAIVQENGVQLLPSVEPGRPQTGAMQFGDDWPGVFIRGDNALWYGRKLGLAVKRMDDEIELASLAGLLSSCDYHRIRARAAGGDGK